MQSIFRGKPRRPFCQVRLDSLQRFREDCLVMASDPHIRSRRNDASQYLSSDTRVILEMGYSAGLR